MDFASQTITIGKLYKTLYDETIWSKSKRTIIPVDTTLLYLGKAEDGASWSYFLFIFGGRSLKIHMRNVTMENYIKEVS